MLHEKRFFDGPGGIAGGQWLETPKPGKNLHVCVVLEVLDCHNLVAGLGRPLRVRPAVPVLQPRREDERRPGQARASLAILALRLHLHPCVMVLLDLVS